MIDCTHTNSYVLTHMYHFVASTTAPIRILCGNSHVSIRSINDGTLFGGRREETREDANKIQIRMIDLPYTNFYVVTHMF